MIFTPEQVGATIDYAVLKPNATDEDVIAGCEVCARYKVASMCVRPIDLPLIVKTLSKGIGVSTVVGFPHGSNLPEVKALEAKMAVEDGAEELDMVMNIGQFLSGDYAFVQKDIEGVVAEARAFGVLVKVILETCYLSPPQIIKACKLCEAAGADYVKTSTGFGSGSATPEAVAIMISQAGNRMKVKASGGIKTWAHAVGFLNQGCSRLGIGAATSDILMSGGS